MMIGQTLWTEFLPPNKDWPVASGRGRRAALLLVVGRS